MRTETSVDDLGGCVRDLVTLLTMPAMWVARPPAAILETVTDVLLGMLRLDFAYAQGKPTPEEGPIAVTKTSGGQSMDESVRRAIGVLVAGDGDVPFVVRQASGGSDLRVIAMPFSNDPEGVLMVASSRTDFPTETELLLIKVARTQAIIGLQDIGLSWERTNHMMLARANDCGAEVKDAASAEEALSLCSPGFRSTYSCRISRCPTSTVTTSSVVFEPFRRTKAEEWLQLH